jgi:membrane protein required for colicin V production
VFIIGAIISYIVVQFVKKTGLSGADRVFGLLFGFLRGGVIIVVFVVIGQKVSISTQQWWQDSTMLKRFENVAIALHDYTPQNVAPSGVSNIIDPADADAIAEKVIEQVNP